VREQFKNVLKHALETLETVETVDNSCYLLKHSWNVLLSLETTETLETLEMVCRGASQHLPDLAGS